MNIKAEHLLLWIAFILIFSSWLAGSQALFNVGVASGLASYAVDLWDRAEEVKL